MAKSYLEKAARDRAALAGAQAHDVAKEDAYLLRQAKKAGKADFKQQVQPVFQTVQFDKGHIGGGKRKKTWGKTLTGAGIGGPRSVMADGKSEWGSENRRAGETGGRATLQRQLEWTTEGYRGTGSKLKDLANFQFRRQFGGEMRDKDARWRLSGFDQSQSPGRRGSYTSFQKLSEADRSGLKELGHRDYQSWKSAEHQGEFGDDADRYSDDLYTRVGLAPGEMREKETRKTEAEKAKPKRMPNMPKLHKKLTERKPLMNLRFPGAV